MGADTPQKLKPIIDSCPEAEAQHLFSDLTAKLSDDEQAEQSPFLVALSERRGGHRLIA
jgi:hypothetical protein